MSEIETTAQQWQRVKTILADALERPSPEDRAAYLESSCGSDTTLMREVEALLALSTDKLDELADNTPTAFVRNAPAQPSGRRVGAYEIVREIGRGGMGAVYLAKRADGQFEKEVAIKLLKRGTDTDEILRRFQAERRILARLDHPNIARLLDAGTTDDGLPYFVMEFIVGNRITEFVREKELSVSDRLRLFLKVCEAVECAHRKRIVHRDLKPSNILVTPAGELKLLDFGIAKLIASGDEDAELTLTRDQRMTPICASPEQARGEPVTEASDIYALGGLLYELLTDHAPRRFSTPHPSSEELVQVICEQEPIRPSLRVYNNQLRRQLRGDLDKIVLMALRKEPEWRYASANTLADDIQSHLSGRPIAARKRTTGYVAIRFLRRQEKRILGAAALAAVGIAVGFFLFHAPSRRELSTALPSPSLAIEDIPEQATQDHEAYDLFLRARSLAYEFGTDSSYQVSLTNAIPLLEEATARDPKFALAYSLLAESHLYLYRAFEHTDAHLAAAKQAADTAQRLAPDSGAAHFAQAVYFYEGVHDLHRAETEITAALRAVPTRADAYEVAEKIERRLGRWKDAIEHGEKAIVLDPRDPALIPSLAEIFIALRRFADVTRITDRALATLPPQFSAPLWRYKATAALGQGDTKAARVALDASPAGVKLNDYTKFRVAVLERNFAEAERIADTIKAEAIQPWLNYRRGLMARVTGNDAGAKRAFEAAREAIKKELVAKPNDPKFTGYLALVEAGLGENEEAVKQAQRAVDLNPISEDASNGAKVAAIQAEVYAWVGQPRAALEKLAALVTIPDGPNYGELLLDPAWDSLRAEPAFARLLEAARRPIDPIPNIENVDPTQAQTIPEKSIAVLPFENLSDDKGNSFFADGIQDEVITDLAQIADLKVISRTSVRQYTGAAARNVREIARELGVAHLLTGTVQRSGNRIHVNAQLLNAHTEAHEWAQQYDRDVSDLFAIQSEIARSIVAQLQARISPTEMNAITQQPTTDLVAYDLYLRANALMNEIATSTDWEGDNRRAIDLLDRAVTHDPKFAVAYAQLCDFHLNLYDWVEHTPQRLAQAETAVQEATRLAPSSAATYLAQSDFVARQRKWSQSLEFLQRAQKLQPGDAKLLIRIALAEDHLGQSREAVRDLEKARELAPRDPNIPNQLDWMYTGFRDYRKSDEVADAAIANFPNGPNYYRAQKVLNALHRGDWKDATRRLALIPEKFDPSGFRSLLRLEIPFFKRDAAEFERLLAIVPRNNLIGIMERDVVFMEAVLAEKQGDRAKMGSILNAFRVKLEAELRAEGPDKGPSYHPLQIANLALVHCYLGQMEEALRESQQAIELAPKTVDVMKWAPDALVRAEILMRAGQTDRAIDLLDEVAKVPYGPSYGELLSLRWDRLRDDPRFAKVLAESARPFDLTSTGDKRVIEPSIPEKSIAVLPFDNLSDDNGHAYFTDGVQEDIQASLAKVADLKVTSHASAALYRGPNKNLREIGRVLRVAHALEGNVQKTQSHVRVYARLTDTRSGAQVWAEQYDRAVDDLFAIQNEITSSIVEQLKAALSPQEQALMQEKPTKNMVAYDLYLQAREIERNSFNGMGETTREIVLLDEATRRDPAFVPALCLLARAHLDLYWLNLDHTAIRLELARKALDTAAQSQPDAGEVHLARAILHYWGSRDYRRALEELAIARGQLPNDPEVLQFTVAIDKRQGHWEEARHVCEQAIALDPLNPGSLRDYARSIYVSMRLYPEASRLLDTVLSWKPNEFGLQRERARIDVASKADLSRLQSVVSGESARTADPNLLANTRLELALWRRDYPAAERALADYRLEDSSAGGFVTPRQWYEGIVARSRGDKETAQNAFTLAHERVAAGLHNRPDDAKALIMLAEIDAALGHKKEAITEGLRAIELLPVSKDAADGPTILGAMVTVYAQLGETNAALDLLGSCTAMPNGPDFGSLKLDQEWDPLRSDPRFDKIVASLAPGR